MHREGMRNVILHCTRFSFHMFISGKDTNKFHMHIKKQQEFIPLMPISAENKKLNKRIRGYFDGNKCSFKS